MQRYSAICEYVPELERVNDDYLRPASAEDPEGDFVKYETAKAEIDELVNMLLYCNPVPAKKTQYEALMDKHRGNENGCKEGRLD